jgi:hypothetical protein
MQQERKDEGARDERSSRAPGNPIPPLNYLQPAEISTYRRDTVQHHGHHRHSIDADITATHATSTINHSVQPNWVSTETRC